MVSAQGTGDLVTGTVKNIRERVRPKVKATARRTHRTMPGQPVEVTVRLSPELLAEVRDMAKVRGISEAQALRDAVGSGLYFERQRRLGQRIILRRPGGQDSEVIFEPVESPQRRG